jgi:FkbM family methyltransferase
MNHVDPVLFPLVQEFVAANSIVWDVGANVGLFAVPAATIAGANGRVIAFEPDTWLVQLLRRSALAQSPATAPHHGGSDSCGF